MIVLDTHALLWWVTQDTKALSPAARQIINDEQQCGQILLSSISAWEIALLVSKRRIGLSMDVEAWLALVAKIGSVRFVPVDNEIAMESVQLPGEFHKDPADRIIVATARKHAALLITIDDKILAYPHVRSLR